MLRAMGLDDKLELGQWFTPVLQGLARGKRLRGTMMDPFGRAKVRRVERKLITEYEKLVADLAGVVEDGNVDTAVALASLPDMVRGYEDIKLDNVDRFRDDDR